MPPASMKSEPKLQAILDVLELTKYTLHITQGRVFWLKPPTPNEDLVKRDEDGDYDRLFILFQRQPLADEIDHVVVHIFKSAWEANNIRVADQARLWLKRKELQEEAIRGCDNLLSLIQLAKAIFHLTARRLKYWTSLILKAENLLKKWRDGDCKRYDHLLKAQEKKEARMSDTLDRIANLLERIVGPEEKATPQAEPEQAHA